MKPRHRPYGFIRRRRDPEHELQVAFIRATRYRKEPELRLLHSIPNGGKRSKTTAGKMKAEGQLAGVPDLFLPVARGSYHGLYLETKIDEPIWDTTAGKMTRTRTYLSPAQKAFAEAVQNEGYAHRVYRSVDEGLAILDNYLAGRLPDTSPAQGAKPNASRPPRL